MTQGGRGGVNTGGLLWQTNVHVCVRFLRLTVFNTRLSRGFLLGSLVEERIPVPQLLAKVFLWRPQQTNQ